VIDFVIIIANHERWSFSGSMEPAFFRGDILFLSMSSDPIRVGDIAVYKLYMREIPIVHRVLRVHEKFVFSLHLINENEANIVNL